MTRLRPLTRRLDRGGGDTVPHRIPVAVPTHRQRIRLQGISMITTTGVPDAIAQAQASLEQDFPGWNIVPSNADRWWAFLDPKRQRKDTVPAEATALEADTSDGLYKQLAAVGS